ELVREKVKNVVVIGEAASKITDAYKGIVPITPAKTMADAVRIAAGKASDGEVVLLAPMCSSFDMFSDYKQRGNIFRQEVMDYCKANSK
ncbi:MAG TPA: UDP-N-acetylmuramoyl-L-alanine--D-glutamate ligase, partial [Candidatus Omnitrophota bacterium]|nr:UDP-N-acetylmuramoyl-L-alanine--D-glutamate ligase [Candidatus Omnitrophota bacterium]